MPHSLRTFLAAALVLTLAIAGVGCSDDDDADGPTSTTTASTPAAGGPSGRQPALEGSISVAAADSLADALPVLVERFTLLNPGVAVTVRYDATPVLAMELLDGAPDDVFLAADQDNMTALVDAGRTDGGARVMARNRLVIITPPGNPEGIASLTDLAGAGEIALCEPDVPCGALADRILEDTDVDVDDIREANATDTVAAVMAGNAAAALVFATTAEAAGDAVQVVALEGTIDATSTHTIATLAPAVNALAARAFVDFVLSPEGQDVLVEQGFLPAR